MVFFFPLVLNLLMIILFYKLIYHCFFFKPFHSGAPSFLKPRETQVKLTSVLQT